MRAGNVWSGISFVLVSMVIMPTNAATATACAPASSVAPGVREALDQFYGALGKSDESAWRKVTSPDFRAFDVGLTFDRQSLFALVRDARAVGKPYEWHRTEPDVKADCRLAFASWVNHGSIKDASGATQVTWLESASLSYEDGHWIIEFLHATRATPPKS